MRTTYKKQYDRGETQFLIVDTRAPMEIRSRMEARGIDVKHALDWGTVPA